MATSTTSEKFRVFESLQVQPLGAGEAEGGLQAPFNPGKQIVIVKLRNLSAIRKRRYYIERISYARGGEEWADEENAKRKGGRIINLDTLRARAANQDVSPTEVAIKPIDVAVTFDGKMYVIPAIGTGAANEGAEGEEAPWITVPDGVFDLYFGHWQRLQNPKERADELVRVRARRQDVIIREGWFPGSAKNDWAFLEFSREVIEPKAMAVDMERVYAGDLVEV